MLSRHPSRGGVRALAERIIHGIPPIMNLLQHESEVGSESGDVRRSQLSDLPTTSDETLSVESFRPARRDVGPLVRAGEHETAGRDSLTIWAARISLPAFTAAALTSGLAHELAWIPTALAGAATVPALFLQARNLHDQRIALKYSHLDRRWIGPLCESLRSVDGRVTRVAALLLEQLLPRLTEADLGLLTEEQLNCLFERLTIASAARSPDLVIAILSALPNIGGEGAVLLVERLADYPRMLPRSAHIREAARTSLARLNQLTETNSAAQEADDHEAKLEPAALSEAEAQVHAQMAAFVDSRIKELEDARSKMQTPGMRLNYLIASYIVIVPYFTWVTGEMIAAHNWATAALTGIAAALGTQLYRLTLMPKHHDMAEALARLDDVRCIGRLAEMLEWPDPHMQKLAVAALTRLLPRIKATDRVFTAPVQRNNLRRTLSLSFAMREPDFVVGLLKALEQVGETADLPYVKHLAGAQAVWGISLPFSGPEAARRLRIRDAARRCLPYLEKTAELGNVSRTLLRASSASDTGSDMLVRAADAGCASNPDELLRAQTEPIESSDSAVILQNTR